MEKWKFGRGGGGVNEFGILRAWGGGGVMHFGISEGMGGGGLKYGSCIFSHFPTANFLLDFSYW